MRHKNVQVAISLFAVCAFFIAPVWVQPCETTEVPEQACCCCPCCEETESAPSENRAQDDECSCSMAESHDQETSLAVLVSVKDNEPQIFPLNLEIKGSLESHRSRPLDLGSLSPILPSRDQPLYILNSSFLI